jgi:hypothetical protein
VAGIATAGAVGARKTARMLTGITDGFHRNGRISGILGVPVGHGNAELALPQARKLGRKIAEDIWTQRKYPFQKLLENLFRSLVLERLMKRNVLENKDGKMKGVYEYWLARGYI